MSTGNRPSPTVDYPPRPLRRGDRVLVNGRPPWTGTIVHAYPSDVHASGLACVIVPDRKPYGRKAPATLDSGWVLEVVGVAEAFA